MKLIEMSHLLRNLKSYEPRSQILFAFFLKKKQQKFKAINLFSRKFARLSAPHDESHSAARDLGVCTSELEPHSLIALSPNTWHLLRKIFKADLLPATSSDASSIFRVQRLFRQKTDTRPWQAS